MNSLLSNINSPEDVKKLSVNQLPLLAEELRSFLIETVTVTGGHLASNLGVVELTVAMVYVYNFPLDKIVWDVGHQSYVYKILTGRRERMNALRSLNGVSGFPDRRESRYDIFNTGHASTSVSAALGIAHAQKLNRSASCTLAVIGDGALTGGMVWEALNELGGTKLPVTVVLNDNNMSIDYNVGGMSKHLSKVRLSKGYMRFKMRVQRFVRKMPRTYRFLKRLRDNIKLRYVHNKIFEQLGVAYIGPIDGHDVKGLVEYFKALHDYKSPVIAHILTKKGKGCQDAECNPTAYHGLSQLNAPKLSSFSLAAGEYLSELAGANRSIVVITAAMTYGTGFSEFKAKYTERLFDVGIAEEHAVTMAAGLAVGGFHPFVAIYSTFLQRAYDQILHDVCLQDLPVTFCIDRAGISGSDGPTHHGLYDIGYLLTMPKMTIYAPKNIEDLKKSLAFASQFQHPFAIRYPKDCVYQANFDVTVEKNDDTKFSKKALELLELGKWEILQSIDDVTIVAYGDRMLKIAFEALTDSSAGLINAAFIQPMDEEVLQKLGDCRRIIVLEDAIGSCGLYSKILDYFMCSGNRRVEIRSLCFPNEVILFGDSNLIFDKYNITAKNLKDMIVE